MKNSKSQSPTQPIREEVTPFPRHHFPQIPSYPEITYPGTPDRQVRWEVRGPITKNKKSA